jgi:hypothetical protein
MNKDNFVCGFVRTEEEPTLEQDGYMYVDPEWNSGVSWLKFICMMCSIDKGSITFASNVLGSAF